MSDTLTIADRTFASRLIVGTGKFHSPEVMAAAVESSGAELVTVALRRMEPGSEEPDLAGYINRDRVLIVTNTSGAENAEEALRLARLARAGGLPDWIKLEVIPDPRYLMPDPVETLTAARQLVKEGFTVLPYVQADPVLCKRLEESGCSTVMPLAAPIGSARGMKMRETLRIIVEQATVPVVIDAGLGVPSHAAEAMELGADAVLVNTAIATAGDPKAMARAFRLGVEAGRKAYLAGNSPELELAQASSPLEGVLGSVMEQ